ncbi:MAG: iron-containing alcohol dehydrogenase, partial [Candidatus Aerophobetes bacterium]|nr:iron-containing alcohol dehydrogenase [Candidatus Aerophobetes bacterium]
SLSKRACNLIKEFGPKAKEDVERKRCTKEVELIIQTNILLTGLIAGLGKERCRSLAAHALNYAMTSITGNNSALHGEKVAFGVIMQLILENRDKDEIEKLLKLYSLLGLPLTLEEIGLINEEVLKSVVKAILQQKRRMNNLPFPVDEDMVYKALLKADEWGRKKMRNKRRCLNP